MYYVRYTDKKESKGEIKLIETIGFARRNHEAYTSIYTFDKSILEYFERNGNSVAGYNGVAYCDIVWFDIDDKKSPENTLPVVRSFLNFLLKEYNLSSKYVIKFFSGKKGFHLGIPQGFFGNIKGSETVPASIKALTQQLMAGFDCYDPSVYNITRLFRIPNSKHEETGLYKRFLTSFEIFNLSFNEIEDLAKEPIENFALEFKPQEITENHKLKSLWEMCNSTGFSTKHTKSYYDTDSALFAPPKVNRNQNLFMMAQKLFRKSSLSFSEIKDIILAIDAASENPLQFDSSEKPSGMKQIEHLLKNAISYSDGKRPSFEEKDPEYMTFGDSIQVLIQNILKDDGGLTTGFPSFDYCLKNRLKGRLLTCIGTGGAKKSLYAQNLIITNCLLKGKRGLYSTMEMPIHETTSRFLDMTLPDQENYSSKLRQELEEGLFTEKDFIGFIKELAADKVLITETPSMTAEKYDQLLQTITKNHGIVDVLVVDGLSMMEDKDGEFQAMSFHSKALKELAKKWDILVVAICHITKGIDKDIRDLTPFIRGSGKVFDNSDYFISFTNLFDVDDEQITNKGFAKLYAKRGDGSIIDVVYDFTNTNLKMKESLEEPKRYLALDYQKKMASKKAKYSNNDSF